MSLIEILVVLRRHVLVVVTICCVAIGVAYGLVQTDPGYQESGVVAITAPKSADDLFAYNNSLLYSEYMLNSYIAGPQGQSAVRAAGATGYFSVAMVNENNEELPYYKNPYLNVAASAGSAVATSNTFVAVLRVLHRELFVLQQSQAVSEVHQVTTRLVFSLPGPVSQRGSLVRVLCAFGALTVVVILAGAYVSESISSRRRSKSAFARSAA